MAKKILSTVAGFATGGLIGAASKLIGGKKKAAAPATTAASTSSRPKPIITPLGSGLGGGLPPRRPSGVGSLLSDKLGS